MDQHVICNSPGVGTGILAEVTFVKFLSLVEPSVNIHTGLVREPLTTLGADNVMIITMESSHVNSYVPFSCTGLEANWALKHWNSINMDLSVLLHTVLLTKSGITNITHIWFLSCVYSDVPLQCKAVSPRVGAILTLKRPLFGVNSHMSVQFVLLNGAVVTLGAVVRLLVCVFVILMTI